MRKQSEYTRRLCIPYNASKHSASPCCARAIASCSDMPLASTFFAVVKLSTSAPAPFDAGPPAYVASIARRYRGTGRSVPLLLLQLSRMQDVQMGASPGTKHLPRG